MPSAQRKAAVSSSLVMPVRTCSAQRSRPAAWCPPVALRKARGFSSAVRAPRPTPLSRHLQDAQPRAPLQDRSLTKNLCDSFKFPLPNSSGMFKSGNPAWASECPKLGVKQTSISGDWMSACSQQRKFARLIIGASSRPSLSLN